MRELNCTNMNMFPVFLSGTASSPVQVTQRNTYDIGGSGSGGGDGDGGCGCLIAIIVIAGILLFNFFPSNEKSATNDPEAESQSETSGSDASKSTAIKSAKSTKKRPAKTRAQDRKYFSSEAPLFHEGQSVWLATTFSKDTKKNKVWGTVLDGEVRSGKWLYLIKKQNGTLEWIEQSRIRQPYKEGRRE